LVNDRVFAADCGQLDGVDDDVELYADPSASQATRDAAAVKFQVLNAYFGVSVGETLGYISMGIWMLAVSVTMQQTRFMPRIVPILCIPCGVGTMAGVLEWTGVPFAADLNAYALQVWLLLLIVIGARLAFRRRPSTDKRPLNLLHY